MKYIIQIFRSDGSIGHWDNTAWGGDDLGKVTITAIHIANCDNKVGATKVRILENILELDCK